MLLVLLLLLQLLLDLFSFPGSSSVCVARINEAIVQLSDEPESLELESKDSCC